MFIYLFTYKKAMQRYFFWLEKQKIAVTNDFHTTKN